MGLLPQRKRAFGVDDNAGHPLIVKAAKVRGTILFDVASPDALRTEYDGSPVSACVLQRESFVRWIDTPIASAAKAARVLPSLLDIQLPFPVEECVVNVLDVQRRPGEPAGTRGLVAGARAVEIEKRLDALSSAGIDPHYLDQESVALWAEGLEQSPVAAGSSDGRVLFFLGPDHITLVTGRGRELISATSMRQLTPDSLQRHLKSAFPTPPPVLHALWTGEGATRPATLSPLREALASRWPSDDLFVAEPHLFLAKALARRALTGKAAPCNLRAGRFVHPAWAQRARRAPYLSAGFCLAAGLLLCLVNAAWLLGWDHRMEMARDELHRIAISITGTGSRVPYGQEVIVAERQVEARSRGMAPFFTTRDAPVRKALQVLLATASRERITFESITLGTQQGVAHGTAPDTPAYERMTANLAALGWTARSERKPPAGGGKRTGFILTLGLPREKR